MKLPLFPGPPVAGAALRPPLVVQCKWAGEMLNLNFVYSYLSILGVTETLCKVEHRILVWPGGLVLLAHLLPPALLHEVEGEGLLLLLHGHLHASAGGGLAVRKCEVATWPMRTLP